MFTAVREFHLCCNATFQPILWWCSPQLRCKNHIYQCAPSRPPSVCTEHWSTEGYPCRRNRHLEPCGATIRRRYKHGVQSRNYFDICKWFEAPSRTFVDSTSGFLPRLRVWPCPSHSVWAGTRFHLLHRVKGVRSWKPRAIVWRRTVRWLNLSRFVNIAEVLHIH